MSDRITLTRRAFLAATTTTVAATALGGGRADAKTRMNAARVVPRKYSPNERLNIAGIGVGGMGHGDIMGCRSENIVAVCDVDWLQAAGAFNDLPNAKRYKDYRKMLDEMGDEIDACTVSTPDHTHAPAAYYAMMLGKHVRVQKPLTHTIAEARLLRRVAEEKHLITAMGNQGNSYDELRELCEMIWSGVIGQVTEVHAWTDRPIWPQGIAEPLREQAVPDTMDWDLWIGSAPFRPYNRKYAPFKWRGWWDFGCGAIGDMACHVLNAAYRALRLMDAPTFTCEVVMQEGMTTQTPPLKSIVKYTFPARAGMGPLDLY
ncbi:MAG TPA: Gfo/Idh/MocA family oxidoreductase, partial [Candidatus Hydrogenedentes bacterium]|nr:Gfo/Idh/MocA family oxidoreductase [Candidatus Hydrogenedentota bacterium]